jgi:carboxyl-terminal processing protease
MESRQKIISSFVDEEGTTVTLHVRHGNAPSRIVTLTRRQFKIPQMQSVLIVGGGGKKYGIIDTVHFGEDFAKDLDVHFLKLKKGAGGKLDGLILSLKNNPGGSVFEALDTIDFFMDVPLGQSGVLKRTRNGIESIPAWTDGNKRAFPGDVSGGIPLLVVVGKESASSSEIVAAVLQLFSRATIAGKSGTFQKGTLQSVIPYLEPDTQKPDGSSFNVTVGEFLAGTTENWVPVQCVGVTPDILIPVKSKNEQESINQGETECSQNSTPSGGPMKDRPPHIPMEKANPLHWKAAQEMTKVFIKWEKAEAMKQKLLLRKK